MITDEQKKNIIGAFEETDYKSNNSKIYPTKGNKIPKSMWDHINAKIIFNDNKNNRRVFEWNWERPKGFEFPTSDPNFPDRFNPKKDLNPTNDAIIKISYDCEEFAAELHVKIICP